MAMGNSERKLPFRQRASIRLRIRRKGQQYRAVGRFRPGVADIPCVQQFEVHIAVGRAGVHVPAAFVYLDIAVHSVEVPDLFHTRDAQSAVDGSEVLHASAARHMDHVFHGYFHAFILRVVGDHAHGAGFRLHLDRDSFQVRFSCPGGFYRVHFNLVSVPRPHFNGSIHILQFE